jgi:hypothetical protein
MPSAVVDVVRNNARSSWRWHSPQILQLGSAAAVAIARALTQPSRACRSSSADRRRGRIASIRFGRASGSRDHRAPSDQTCAARCGGVRPPGRRRRHQAEQKAQWSLLRLTIAACGWPPDSKARPAPGGAVARIETMGDGGNGKPADGEPWRAGDLQTQYRSLRDNLLASRRCGKSENEYFSNATVCRSQEAHRAIDVSLLRPSRPALYRTGIAPKPTTSYAGPLQIHDFIDV